MRPPIARISASIYARVAGLVYLMVIPLGIFSLFVSSRLVVPGDGAATTRNLMGSEFLFRLGIVSDLLASILMILVVLLLYQVFQSVNQNIALLMIALVLIGAAISMFDQLHQLAALQVLSGAGYLNVFTKEQLQSLVLLFLRLYNLGGDIAFIFWGLWLFPLGYLVFKSGLLPKILGILLMITCLGYPIQSFAALLGYRVNVGMFAALGEVLFILWLLIRGINIREPDKRVLESA